MEKGPLKEVSIEGAGPVYGPTFSLPNPGFNLSVLAVKDIGQEHGVPAGLGLQWCFRVWAVDPCIRATWGVY